MQIWRYSILKTWLKIISLIVLFYGCFLGSQIFVYALALTMGIPEVYSDLIGGVVGCLLLIILVFWRNRRLTNWITISIHFFNNFTSSLLSKYVSSDIPGSLLWSGCFFVITILFVIWLYRQQNNINKVKTEIPANSAT